MAKTILEALWDGAFHAGFSVVLADKSPSQLVVKVLPLVAIIAITG